MNYQLFWYSGVKYIVLILLKKNKILLLLVYYLASTHQKLIFFIRRYIDHHSHFSSCLLGYDEFVEILSLDTELDKGHPTSDQRWNRRNYRRFPSYLLCSLLLFPFIFYLTRRAFRLAIKLGSKQTLLLAIMNHMIHFSQ